MNIKESTIEPAIKASNEADITQPGVCAITAQIDAMFEVIEIEEDSQ